MNTDATTLEGAIDGASISRMETRSKYPPQIKYIVGNEAAERFSFYGMRSILVVFMTQYLLMAREDATAVFHLFVSACYLMPVIGAYLSDRFLGKYRVIMLFSSVYCLGHGALALWENQMGLFLGLTLISIGAGGIKPCVAAHVGDQFTSKNRHLVKGIFDIFYWSVNFGSFFATMLIPILLKKYGPGVAFGIPGILMLVATVVFWMGRNLYVHVPPTGKRDDTFLSIVWYALKNQSNRKKGEPFLSVAQGRFTETAIDGAQAALNLFKVFITISVFWALFDQHSSTWILQAKQMNLNAFGMEWEASQVGALNPIMVMVLIPFFSYVVYPLAEKMGVRLTSLGKIATGMFIASLSFAVVAIYQHLLDGGVQLSVVWHFIPFLIITCAEVMISITGLEFAYTQAPKEMKSTILSFWYLTIFAGNLLTAYISKVNVFEGAWFFVFFATLMFAVTGVFMWGARGYKIVDRMQDS